MQGLRTAWGGEHVPHVKQLGRDDHVDVKEPSAQGRQTVSRRREQARSTNIPGGHSEHMRQEKPWPGE